MTTEVSNVNIERIVVVGGETCQVLEYSSKFPSVGNEFFVKKRPQPPDGRVGEFREWRALAFVWILFCFFYLSFGAFKGC